MNRGARREPVFFDAYSCSVFLDCLAELPERFGLLVHGYTLMPNHFHLMLESRSAQLSRGMAYLTARYTQWTNARRGWDGALFRGRFRQRLVHSNEHWKHLLAYIHLNPVRARLVVTPEQGQWTSHGQYAGSSQAPDWLTTGELLALFGGSAGYLAYLDAILAHRMTEPDGFDAVSFRAQEAAADLEHEPLPHARDDKTLEEVFAEICRVLGCSPEELQESRRGRSGNAPRLVAAYWLVRRGRVPHKEVGRLLAMSSLCVSKALARVKAASGKGGEIDELIRALEDGSPHSWSVRQV